MTTKELDQLNKIPHNAVMPFFCGSQWDAWQERNCANCAKGEPFTPFPACPIADAVMDIAAGLSDGLTPEMVKRMGHKSGAYTWQCGEFEVAQ